MISFIIPGTPVAKGRPRARVIQKRGTRPMAQLYTPAETRAAEEAIRVEAKALRRAGVIPREPLVGPLSLQLVFILSPPMRMEKGRSTKWPHVRSDLDNYVKLFADAMNGFLFEDDSQVCAISAVKRYGTPPRIEVQISQLSDTDSAQVELWGGIDG